MTMEQEIAAGLPNLEKLREFKDLPGDARNLLAKMLRKDPESRPSAKKALEHYWFSEFMWNKVADNEVAEFEMVEA
jgi:serine/threonine protein kinase